MYQRFLSLVLLTALATGTASSSLTSSADQGDQILQQGFSLMQEERLGNLRLNLPEREVSQKVRCNLSRGKEVMWGATGEYVQQWQYPKCGISLYMSSAKQGGAKQVLSIKISSPSTFKTRRGIGIGSPASAVMKTYGQFYNPADSQPGKTIVAGTVYGGVIFFLENGRVSQIFVGAAAE